LAIISGNLLGYHPYEWWTNKQRSGEGWRAATSMRWDHMEFAWGLKPEWIFTENGPLESAVTGWRHSKCLGGDRNLYVEAVRLWIQDVAKTAAYQEGRIRGFSLFTTFDQSAPDWGSFHTQQPEMNQLASMIAAEWKPGTKPEPPPINVELHRHLWDESVDKQAISLNPDAALQAAIFRDGFVPVESEFWTPYADEQYAVMAAEHLESGARRVYYAEVPEWRCLSGAM
jgi:hypothetical protein